MAVPQSFPAKIYQILENESCDIIRWNNDGCSFRIVDHGRFEREIVPKYFRHNQISSVQRQLNLYGFKCISRGELRRSFFHPRFKKGEWEVVKKLTRYIPPKKSSPFQDNNNNYTYDNNGQQRSADLSIKNPSVQQQYNNFTNMPFENDNLKQAPSIDVTPRDSKPSELAMRLGFRHTSDAPNPVNGVMNAASNTNLPQAELQLPPAPTFDNDFELIKEFDFFDNFTDFDFQYDHDMTKCVNPQPSVPSGPISCKPEKVIVLPVPSAPTENALSKTTCDVSCMTDLVYSEKHGGFIYM